MISSLQYNTAIKSDIRRKEKVEEDVRRLSEVARDDHEHKGVNARANESHLHTYVEVPLEICLQLYNVLCGARQVSARIAEPRVRLLMGRKERVPSSWSKKRDAFEEN